MSKVREEVCPFRITGGGKKMKRWTSITQPQEQPASYRQIVYDNRVLHIRKKFTIPTEPQHYTQRRQSSPSPKQPESHFRKYIDSVIKNKALCRRGPCNEPFVPLAPAANIHRIKRIKTDCGISNSKANDLLHSQRLATQMSKHSLGKKSITKMTTCQDSNRQLPELKLKIERQDIRQSKHWKPIKVQRFVSKGVRKRGSMSERQNQRQERNIMARRLDVELVNYLLLSKQPSYFC